MLIAALKVENRMRLSVEGQAAFARAEAEADQDWMEAAARMQFAALREVGLAPTVRNVSLLRATALLHPELALYVRNNRCRQGRLQIGDPAPRVQLHSVGGGIVVFPPIAAAGARDQQQVVFAGSVT